jgi:hypothetical protein
MGEEKQIIGKVNFYNQKSSQDKEEIILWENTNGMIIKNNSLIGYIDKDNQYIYFDKKEV